MQRGVNMRYRKPLSYSTTIPKPEGSGWMEFGQSRIWLSDFVLADNKSPGRSKDICPPALYGHGTHIARNALDFLFNWIYPHTETLLFDWVVRIARGLSKEVYRIDVIDSKRKDDHIDSYAVGIVLADAREDVACRIIKEQSLLQCLYHKVKFYSIPKPVGILWQEGLLISVTEFVLGCPIETKTPKSRHPKPWELVARVAAETHKFSKTMVPLRLKAFPTWQDHISAKTKQFQHYSELSEIRDALAWIKENISVNRESVLVHGDLLGQNILQNSEDSLYVIDWEYSFIGHPAYDLAIVTRGIKNPFQVPSGLDRFLEAYRSFGGQHITKKEVYIFEFFLNFGWYGSSLDRSKGGHGPDYYLEAISRLLNRASQE